jgi:hypothetical protein
VLLDYLAGAGAAPAAITDAQRAALERRWLFQKLFRGTS